MLVEEAIKIPAKRWVDRRAELRVRAVRSGQLQGADEGAQPDVEFVAEQWPALGKLEAGSTVQALLAARPEAIFNVDLWGRPAAAREARATSAGCSRRCRW